MSKIMKNPHLVMLIVVIIWGAVYPVGRYVAEGLSPLNTAFSRVFVSFLTCLVLFRPRFSWGKIRHYFPLILVASLTGMVCFMSFLALGLNGSTASNGSLINSFTPTVTAIFGMLFLKERLTRKRWLSVFLALSGVFILIFFGHADGFGFSPYDLFFVINWFMWGSFSVVSVYLHWHFEQGEWLTLVHGLAAIILFPIAMTEGFNIPHMTGGALGGILFMGILGGVIGNYLYCHSVNLLGVGKASFYMNLQPFLSVIIAYFLLGERLLPMQFIGGAILLAGVIWGTYLDYQTKVTPVEEETVM